MREKKLKLTFYLFVLLTSGVFVLLFFFHNSRAQISSGSNDNSPDSSQDTSSISTLEQKPVNSPKTKNNGVGLGFESLGMVKKIYVHSGDKVTVGDILAEIDDSLLTAQLHEAQANLQIQKATLEQMQPGNSTTDIQIAQLKTDIAALAVSDAKKNLIAALLDGYTKSDDAIRTKVDQVFLSPRSNNPQIILITSFSRQLQFDLSNRRLILETTLNAWKNDLMNVNEDADLVQYSISSEANLLQVRNFIAMVAPTLDTNCQDSCADSTVSPIAFSATTLRNWKTDISTGRANIETGIKNLWSAKEKLQDAQLKLQLAQAELDKKRQPHSHGELMLQESKVNEAVAKVEIIQNKLDKTKLTAPLGGIISSIKIRAGTIINNSSPVIFIK